MGVLSASSSTTVRAVCDELTTRLRFPYTPGGKECGGEAGLLASLLESAAFGCWKLKVAICCGRPASMTVKSSFFKSVTGLPLRSVTTTSSCTRRVFTVTVVAGAFCADGGSAVSGAFDFVGCEDGLDVCEPAGGV